MLRVLVTGLVLLVAVMFIVPRVMTPPPAPAIENATLLEPPQALPEFSLVETGGEPFTNASLEGRFTLLFFGFTNCPDVCPITLQLLGTTLERLRAQGGPVPDVVFVSVDPQRDSLERIRDYTARFDPAIIGVTGDEAQLDPLTRALGVGVEKHEHEGEQYNVVHSGAVYMTGPGGDWVAVSTPPLHPDTLAADITAIHATLARR